MRILHVSPYSDGSFGGPVSTLVGLAAAQRRAGAQVTVATMLHRGGAHSIIPQLEVAGVDVVTAGYGRGPLMQSSRIHGLSGLPAQHDVVHVHGVWEQMVGSLLRYSFDARVPSVLRPCGMLTSWSLSRHAVRKRVLWKLRTRRALSRATAIHFASAQERDETGLVPIGDQQAFIEPNGIDTASCGDGNATRFRTQLAIPPDARVILFVGRLHPGKGLQKLIRSFGALVATGSGEEPGLQDVLVIAGPADSDAYAAELRSIAASTAAHARVRFTGMIDSTTRRDALAAATVFVLPSDHESFGNSALEALAAGVPCLLTDRVPLSSHVTEHDCGVVCPPEEAAIAGALRDLLARTDSAERDGMSQRARACALQFDWSTIAARLGVHYEKLIARR